MDVDTDRQLVLQHYPEARIEWVGFQRDEADSDSSHAGYWGVFPLSIGRARAPLGTGATREDAWTDAANLIRMRGH